MSPRRRSKAKAGFPPNLYEKGGYFTWRNPLTKDTFGFGNNRARAFSLAHRCNAKVLRGRTDDEIVERATGDKSKTVAAWEEKYLGIVAKRGLTKETRSNYLAFSRRVVKMLGQKAMRSVTAQNVADGLEAIAEAEGKPRTAQAVRAYMRQSFETAVTQGWVDANPVRANIIIGDKSAKRARLSLEVFMRVYESAPTEWLRNAMALALVSAQRREDICNAQFKDFHGETWWLVQASEKTDHPHRIAIPFGLRPAGFHLCLGEVVSRCRRTGVLSNFLVHQTEWRGKSFRGANIRLSTVTRAFTDAVKALEIDWGESTPPTFHEIRSLSLRLYGAQGVNAQLLAGHSDPDTTAIYLNSRGAEYVRVTV